MTTASAWRTATLTEPEYVAQKTDLEAQLVALEAEWAASQVYPHAAYHATEPSRIVYSEAEALALGAGWSPVPLPPAAPAPVVTALDPDTAVIGTPSFTLHVRGTGFAPGAVIVFNGYDEPTTVVTAAEVTTGVNMDVWTGPSAPLPVAVRNPDGALSNERPFTFLVW